ncbi:MAG: hypothetical protein ACYDH0_05085 [Candidatus Aminicenantales bacterium]
MSRKALAWAFLAWASAAGLEAQSRLFYLELQGVAGWSTGDQKIIFHSMSADEVMQKSSLGFDYVLKLSGKTRDIGTLAVQARLAYDPDGSPKAEVQLYNAYFKYKAGFADIWVGHSRPALGLSASLDSHALILPTLAMLGYGFDRDWGAGLSRDFSWGDAAFSLTAGSGMPLRLSGNYLIAARVSKGVLARDNYSAGLSLASGNVLDVMGYHLMSEDPASFHGVSADLTHLWNNLENRAEVFVGSKAGRSLLALFWRLGVNLLEEGRLKIEGQPVLMKTGPDWTTLLSAGASFQANADLALRAMVQRDNSVRDTRFVLQIYYYKALR